MNLQNLKDLNNIIYSMKNEKMYLEEWELVDIPCEKVYCFYNKKRKEAFDFEEDENGILAPHYYCVREGTKITKIPTKTIKEAIENYQL
ncbi:hypothetical protein EUZ95_04645 [Enterococcus durans]|uniref:hypothetical protein n=1 Tax=Enterococcus durans TaxID=53345 RepID=UPI0010408394|nr:hypothetical protein [Enterococcus durans]TBX33708.1 hypothetical protein EUZ95_04645 [Enterococcus durans]